MNRRLLALALPFVIPVAASAQTFGAASSFNLFASNDVNVFSSDVEGKVAAGGNFTASSYSVGANLPAGQNALVVGGNVNYTNGSVNGNIVRGGTATLSSFGFNGGGQNIQQANPLPFSAIAADLQARSSAWAGLAATGTTFSQWGGLHFSGWTSGLNVFNVNASDIASAGWFNINAPSGASVLINVIGSNVTIPNTGFGNLDSTKTIWNFSQATTISPGSFVGSILAPNATINSTWSNINGQVFAKNYTGPGQVNLHLYNGITPAYSPAPVPEPATMAVLGLGALGLLRRRAKKA